MICRWCGRALESQLIWTRSGPPLKIMVHQWGSEPCPGPQISQFQRAGLQPEDMIE